MPVYLENVILICRMMDRTPVVVNKENYSDVSAEFEFNSYDDRYFESRVETLQSIDQFKFINVTSIKDVVELFDSNFGLFLVSLFCACVWIVYITFYSSRVTGLVVGRILNRFLKDGDISIGNLFI